MQPTEKQWKKLMKDLQTLEDKFLTERSNLYALTQEFNGTLAEAAIMSDHKASTYEYYALAKDRFERATNEVTNVQKMINLIRGDIFATETK